ncbi:ADP-ribosylglycohydrolase-domain-containing protein [Mycena sp. CBHHK59/15]|nr:ADP-ribosylglycohydrolase-domain-containing protein [Mycena sp. CBHHK59/15]
MASLPFDLPLHTQRVTPSSPETKIRLSLLATAMVDALGGPAEFRPRFSFDFISALLPNDNFGLPPGVWTDDTSMTLCLARSLATVGAFDEGDQLDAYLEWWSSGTLSATGECFDIGNTTQRALSIYEDARNEVVGRRKAGIRQLVRKVANRRNTLTQAEKSEAAAIALPRIRENMSGESCGGNGSLMRVLPVALAYWRDAGVAQAFARRSSETTHPNPACAEACEVWTGAIARVLQAATTPGASLTKLDVLHYFATFPYVTDPLRAALVSDVAFGPSQSNVDIAPEAMEATTQSIIASFGCAMPCSLHFPAPPSPVTTSHPSSPQRKPSNPRATSCIPSLPRSTPSSRRRRSRTAQCSLSTWAATPTPWAPSTRGSLRAGMPARTVELPKLVYSGRPG